LRQREKLSLAAFTVGNGEHSGDVVGDVERPRPALVRADDARPLGGGIEPPIPQPFDECADRRLHFGERFVRHREHHRKVT